jgi:hypothetical protein
MIAALIGIAIAFMLPKRIDCGTGFDVGCKQIVNRIGCDAYEVEPWGFYLLERVFRTDIGFAYEVTADCR